MRVRGIFEKPKTQMTNKWLLKRLLQLGKRAKTYYVYSRVERDGIDFMAVEAKKTYIHGVLRANSTTWAFWDISTTENFDEDGLVFLKPAREAKDGYWTCTDEDTRLREAIMSMIEQSPQGSLTKTEIVSQGAECGYAVQDIQDALVSLNLNDHIGRKQSYIGAPEIRYFIP